MSCSEKYLSLDMTATTFMYGVSVRPFLKASSLRMAISSAVKNFSGNTTACCMQKLSMS